MSPAENETRRMRRIRRDIRRRESHRDWVLKRLGLEHHSSKLMVLRSMLKDLSNPLSPPRTGISWQENRLPKPDGPQDCLWCHATCAALVPVRYQRLFEDELRANPGMSNLKVWRKLGYDRMPEVQRGGHGQIAIARSPHSEHADLYRDSASSARPA